MVRGGQCYEDGPFFPTAPRYVVRNGIAKTPQLLLKPDWPAITGIVTSLLLILITCILLLVWFKDLGWTQKTAGFPKFRKRHLKYNFNSYSSKGAAVSTVKKLHPKTRIKTHADKKWDESDKKKCRSFLVNDEFWDYDQQVDMECFNTHVFYDILLKQSLLVTAKLGHLKEEVKIYYDKLVHEVSTLKDVFAKCLSISYKQKRYSSSILESYKRKKKEAELEIAKRKLLAAEYEEILNKQLGNLEQDSKSLEDHCVVFNGALRECLRLLEMLKTKNSIGESASKLCVYNSQSLMLQLEDACSRMHTAVMKECERLKAWGVLGEGTGAYLINKDRTCALTKRDLIALDGSVRDGNLVSVNSTHGLLSPASHSVMLLSSHYLMPAPDDYFVHSETGKVLPIAGNVVYDPTTSQLITTVDSAFGEITTTETLLFPFIPYPLCPRSGLPVECNLPSINHHKKYEGLILMLDHASGMEVPILAVTIHPQTRQWMALGGTYAHPLTGMISPIEIGGPMIDPKTGKIFPILGIELDSNTGHVIPVGGLMSTSGEISVFGDEFCEPLSGKKVRLQGAVFNQGKVVPHSGGYQALLESNLLMAEINVIDALKALKDTIPGDDFIVKDDFEQVYRALDKAMENMKRSIAIRQQHLMYRTHNLKWQKSMAMDFKCYGGNLGMIFYPRTELWLPAVLGMEIHDPGPSDIMVPILGVEYDFIKGHLIPLAGTMEDAEGKGLIPIELGARTIDPITGDSGSVVGAQTSPLTGIIMPVVQSGTSSKGKDYYLLESLGRELKSRERFWQNQKNKEGELLKDLKLLLLYIADAAREDKIHKSRFKDKIVSLEELCQSVEESTLRETQRRSKQNLNSLSIKISQLPFMSDNTEEMERQLMLLMVVRKTMEKLVQFSHKLEHESERLRSQTREWQKSREQIREEIVGTKQNMVRLSLIDEFEDHMMKRLIGVDTAYSKLEYVREYIKLQGLQAKLFLLGRAPQYLNSQTSYWNVVGKEVQDLGRTLTPMLKYLIQIMEEKKNYKLLAEPRAPASGYSSRSTLKASAANSDSFQVVPIGDTEKLSSNVPWFTNADIVSRHQDYLFRFLTEKQASELVNFERLLLTEEINKIWNFYETYNVKAHGKINTNLSQLLFSFKDKERMNIEQCNPGKLLGTSQESEMYAEWQRLLEELTEVHRTARQALHQKHLEEVKSMGLNPASIIPEDYFGIDVRASIQHLAKNILPVCGQWQYDAMQEMQGMSSVDAKLLVGDTRSHNELLRSIATKFVKHELVTQAHVYKILDFYNKLQINNCPGDVQKIVSSLCCTSLSGQQAAEEAAHTIEDSQVENLIAFLRKYYKEEQLLHIQYPLSEMQTQLKEEHCLLTEQMLQERDKLLFEELANSENRSYTEHVVCCVLSQRHFRQIILLQEGVNASKNDQAKLARKLITSEDDTMTGHCQEDIFSLFNNKTETGLLLVELQHLVKRIQMREHYIEQIADCLKEYCSDKVHILTFVEEAYYLANEVKSFREQKLKKLQEELQEISDQSTANEKTSGRGEEKIRPEKILLNSLQEKQTALENLHRKQISEEQLKLQDQLERGELNVLLKQKLIKEHDETVTFLEKTFERDLEILKMKLEAEVKKREEGIHNVNTNTSSGKKGTQNDDQSILTLLAENINIFQQAEQIMASRISLLVPQIYSSNLRPDGNATKLHKISESSPVLALLKEVDTQLRVNAQSALIIQDSNELHKGNAFRDIQDLQLTPKGELIVMNQEDLNPREIVIYQYGLYILELLENHLNASIDFLFLDSVTLIDNLSIIVGKIYLHVASSLPANTYKGNAFVNSFYYQTSESKLYVAHEYLKSIGSFILLIVHCISHIACEDFGDDSHTSFLRVYYQAIKICFSDGFFSRILSLPSEQDNMTASQVHEGMHTDLLFNPCFSRLKTKGKPGFKKAFDKSDELLNTCKIEILLRNMLGERKRRFFNKNFKDIPSVPENEERFTENFTKQHIEEELDRLNFELMKIMEKEVDLRREHKEEDEMLCYFQMISLEKECTRKKIERLENEIDKQTNLV
ncbi:uncharacterized protein LOC134576981 [Pelobates fuscus]|uniref:uncharacterized protein LOC134576981 n=1 Tax=Pelobates fuscus TaxID=191477 RepID=UPI002FE493DA